MVCDGHVKYEEGEVDRLVAILQTNNGGGGRGTLRVEYSEPASARAA